MCLVCVLHKLIILSKFLTEKKKKKEEKEKTLHLHYSKIIVFVVLLSFCVILTHVRMTRESECVNDKLVKFQLMHYDYTSYLLTTHSDYPNYICAFGGVNRSAIF